MDEYQNKELTKCTALKLLILKGNALSGQRMPEAALKKKKQQLAAALQMHFSTAPTIPGDG